MGEQIHFVSVALELFLNVGQEFGLHHELGHICNILREVFERLGKPLPCLLNSNFVLCWQQCFYSVVDIFGGRLKFRLDFFGVDLQHANVSAGWKVALEVTLMVFKKLHHVSNSFHSVFEPFVF